MPNHVDDVLLHAMDGPSFPAFEPNSTNCEIANVRHIQYNVQRVFWPWPLWHSFFPAHHQVHIPTSPVRVAPCGCLRCFHQQKRSEYALLLMCPSRCLPALESSHGMAPCSCRSAAARKPPRRPMTRT